MKWDKRFVELAKQIATWSKDPSTQVGAVLVQGRVVIATGYNGYPAGDKDDNWAPEYKRRHMVHAEDNCLLHAIGKGIEGGTMYVSFVSCPKCVNLMCVAGIKRIVTPAFRWRPRQPEWNAKWDALYNESVRRAKEYDIEWSFVG